MKTIDTSLKIIAVLLSCLLLFACGGGSSESAQTGKVLNATLLGAFTPESLEDYLDQAVEEMGIDVNIWNSIKGILVSNFKYDVAAYSVAYTP